MHHLATGIFMWNAPERRTDRYGGFYAGTQTYGGESPSIPVTYNHDAIKALRGKRVRVLIKVIEHRESGHVGAEESTAAAHPVFGARPHGEDDAIVNPDGQSVQMKTHHKGPFTILPEIEDLGGGETVAHGARLGPTPYSHPTLNHGKV